MTHLEFIHPVAGMRGHIDGRLYVRCRNGKYFLQHCPDRSKQVMSEKQRQVCIAFGQKWGTDMKGRKRVKHE